MLKNVIKMLLIGFLYPVGDKTGMKMFNTKQRYLDSVLGEKILMLIGESGTGYIKKIFILFTGNFQE